MNTLLRFDIEWGGLHRAWWAPFFLSVILFAWWGYARRHAFIAQLTHLANIRFTFPQFSIVREWLRALLLSLAAVTMFIAVLQPQWGEKEETIVQQGRDLIIALDISRSMLAQDVKPSRLEFVKLKVRKLIQSLSFERVGLILFSGTSFLQCPLTADYKTFLMFLDQVSAESISSGTTDIQQALQEALGVFARSKERKHRLMLLITDGEDFASDVTKLSSIVTKEQITLFAWGVGTTTGAPVPIIDAAGVQRGYEKEPDGSIAITKLNSELLRSMTTSLNGLYLPVSQDDGDIATLVTRISEYEAETFDEHQVSRYHDQYPWFLGATFITLLCEWLL